MEAITLRELLEAVGGTLIGPAAGLEQTVSHVDTDSRNIHPGSLFIPLVGERFDGHAYINSALEGGAAGCLTQRERESYREDRFYIKVKDTQRALRDLAAWYKDRFPIPFVGVTGSVGKTTAKDMIAAVLGVKYKVLKTEGLTTLADYFVICTATSTTQIKAMSDACEEAMEKNGEQVHHIEGHRGGTWLLMDFSAVVVHIFMDEARKFYDLERLWGDAEEIPLEKPQAAQ